jgi:NADH-quinone oxidoreductase subunit L
VVQDNDPHADHYHGHGDHMPHESPLVMLIPLIVLATGALVAGFAFHEYFIGHHYDHFWKGALFTNKDNHILHDIHNVPSWVKYSPFVMMGLGFILAYLMYLRDPSRAERLAASQPLLYKFLLNKWYFDELYNAIFVKPSFAIGRFLWKKGDGKTIDGLGPDGIAATVQALTGKIMRLQTGFMYHYAFAMLIGVAAIMTWITLGGRAH